MEYACSVGPIARELVEKGEKAESMVAYQARVSFHDLQESAVDAVVSIADDHLAIEVDGRPIGRWPIDELSPRLAGDSVLVSAEGEHLVIDVSDPRALRVSLRLPEPPPAKTPQAESQATQTDRTTTVDGPEPPGAIDDRALNESPTTAPMEVEVVHVRLRDLQTGLAEAQTQLKWVQELVPRRLPIPLREHEAGLGVVQGVRLKERRPLPGSDGLQPWVAVDSGNVYVTSMRLVFSGTQDVEFEFDEINKKGASRTGLLLGVTSRIQTHILAGPGERLASEIDRADPRLETGDPEPTVNSPR